MKILIIEKGRNAAIALEEAGIRFSCSEVHDASRAMAMIDEGDYQLVVLNCDMTGQESLSMVKHIRRQDAPGCVYLGDSRGGVYILIVGCQDDEVAMNTYFNAGADEVLCGPLRTYELSKSVKAADRIVTLNRALTRTCARMTELEKAASIGQLVPGITHEINNPLGFVSGNLTVLTDYCRRLCEQIRPGWGDAMNTGSVGAAPAAQQGGASMEIDSVLSDIFPLLNECREGLDRMKALVRDIQQVSRDDAGHPVDIDINNCLDTTLNVLWNELKYMVVIHKSYGKLQPVNGYPGKIHHVFLNLLLHAVHMIGEKGEINIATTNGNGQITVSITRSGRFETNSSGDPPRARVDSSIHADAGLRIVQAIVQYHDGSMEMEPSRDGGVTYRVRLPVK